MLCFVDVFLAALVVFALLFVGVTFFAAGFVATELAVGFLGDGLAALGGEVASTVGGGDGSRGGRGSSPSAKIGSQDLV